MVLMFINENHCASLVKIHSLITMLIFKTEKKEKKKFKIKKSFKVSWPEWKERKKNS